MKNKIFQLRKDGHKISAQVLGNQLWIHLNGRTFAVDYQKRPQKFGGQSKESGDQLLAPMPGRITKVFGSPNAMVKKGEVVVVMEAMKMEYSLKADADAQIDQINCKEGEQVTLGKVLVKFKKNQKQAVKD
jgi:acetyl/propionyl-CoA carboxylase alpha subunit